MVITGFPLIAGTETPTPLDVTIHTVGGGPSWLEWVTAGVAVLAAISSLSGLVLQQRIASRAARQSENDHFTRRYHEAVEQLGHSDAMVRLAGAHAIARLADDWPDQRQMCIDVLTSYLQVPYETDSRHELFRVGERETRRNILRLIRNHLREGFSSVSWRGYNFRFEGAIFEGGDLTGAHFTGGNVTFHGARFVGPGKFYFDDVVINGGQVYFTKTEFAGGVVSFCRARLQAGKIDFQLSQHTGGTVTFEKFVKDGGVLKPGPFTADADLSPILRP